MSEVFETKDRGLAEHALSAAYSSMRIQARGQQQGFRIAQTALGPIRLDRLRFGTSFHADSGPLGVLAVAELISGRIRCNSDGSERSYRPGDVYLTAQPEQPVTAILEDAEVDMAVIGPALLSQVADTGSGRTQRPVRLTGYKPISSQAAQTWKATLAFVRSTALSVPEATSQTLLAASAARLLVATTLAAFPNNAPAGPTPVEGRRDAHSGTLRRAVAFIDEHAHTDITTADIAAAASVSIRAVQFAFQRHMDTTPDRIPAPRPPRPRPPRTHASQPGRRAHRHRRRLPLGLPQPQPVHRRLPHRLRRPTKPHAATRLTANREAPGSRATTDTRPGK